MHLTADDVIATLAEQLAHLADSLGFAPLRERLNRALWAELELLRLQARGVRGEPPCAPAEGLDALLQEGPRLDLHPEGYPDAAVAAEWLTVLRAGQQLLAQARTALQELAEGQDQPLYRSHRHVYATKKLKPFNCNWIDFRLLAGRNPLTALDARWLLARGVTHVLDLREAWEWAAPGRFGQEALDELDGRVVRLHIPVVDMGEPTPEQFDQAVAFLGETLSDPRTVVYVHCRAGAERTGAILVAYWARRFDLTYSEALRQLRQRRPLLSPLPNQEAATRRWLERKRIRP